MLKKALESLTHEASGGQNQDHRGSTNKEQALKSHFVDAELALEATADALIEGDLHGVVDVAHLVSAHLVLDVQTHHWRTGCKIRKKQKPHIFFMSRSKHKRPMSQQREMKQLTAADSSL